MARAISKQKPYQKTSQEKPVNTQVTEEKIDTPPTDTGSAEGAEAIRSDTTGVNDESVSTAPNTSTEESQEGASVSTPPAEADAAPAPAPTPAPAAQDAGASGAVVANAEPAAVAAAPAKTEPAEVKKPSGLSDVAISYISQVEDYMAQMAPNKPMAEANGIRYQVSLFRVLTRMIDNLDVDFRAAWATVLDLAYKHKDGAFNERYVMRFVSNLTLTKEEVTAFLLLLDLIRMSAEPVTRANPLKQYDMSKLQKYRFTEKGRRNLNAFYGL